MACLAVAAATLVFIFTQTAQPERPKPVLGQSVGNFVLLDHNGRSQDLYMNGDVSWVAIVAYDGSCIHADAQVRVLQQWSEKMGGKLRVLLLSSLDNDSRETLIKRKLPFPVLMDMSQTVFQELGLYSTGHVALIEAGTWKLEFLGPLSSSKASGSSVGECDLTLADSVKWNYTEHIAPLFKKECLSCHSQIGGFQPYFDSYEKVKSWVAMIKETVLTERMPPFSGDPSYGPFVNDISLTPKQKFRLVNWVNQGAPRGEGPDPLKGFELPQNNQEFLKKNKPIMTIKMEKPIKIPPRGIPEYQYFQLGGKVERDMWITAVHTKTTNPRQLHHECLMATDRPLEEYERLAKLKRKPQDPISYDAGEVPLYTLWAIMEDPNRFSRLQNTTAGIRQPVIFKHGSSWHIKKGHYFILEAHYMGTGKWEEEETTIDLYGAFEPAGTKAVYSVRLLTGDIDIPPGARQHLEHSRPEFISRDSKFLGFSGHLHMRGRAIRVIMTKPGMKPEILLSVPNYYYGWQTGAGLIVRDPVPIPAGTRLQLECEYDNSKYNPYNPDPSRRVRKGQRLDRAEMCHASLQFVEDTLK